MSVSSSCPADTVTNRLTPYTTEVGLTLGTYIHVVLTFSRLAIGKDFGQRFFQNNVKVIVAILICVFGKLLLRDHRMVVVILQYVLQCTVTLLCHFEPRD